MARRGQGPLSFWRMMGEERPKKSTVFVLWRTTHSPAGLGSGSGSDSGSGSGCSLGCSSEEEEAMADLWISDQSHPPRREIEREWEIVVIVRNGSTCRCMKSHCERERERSEMDEQISYQDSDERWSATTTDFPRSIFLFFLGQSPFLSISHSVWYYDPYKSKFRDEPYLFLTHQ